MMVIILHCLLGEQFLSLSGDETITHYIIGEEFVSPIDLGPYIHFGGEGKTMVQGKRG